jgi:hypothetical protein
MIPVAVLETDHYTSSSAATSQTPPAVVCYLGAMSGRPADSYVGAPEAAINYAAAATALLRAPDVEEVESGSVSPGSPFGI